MFSAVIKGNNSISARGEIFSSNRLLKSSDLGPGYKENWECNALASLFGPTYICARTLHKLSDTIKTCPVLKMQYRYFLLELEILFLSKLLVPFFCNVGPFTLKHHIFITLFLCIGKLSSIVSRHIFTIFMLEENGNVLVPRIVTACFLGIARET